VRGGYGPDQTGEMPDSLTAIRGDALQVPLPPAPGRTARHATSKVCRDGCRTLRSGSSSVVHEGTTPPRSRRESRRDLTYGLERQASPR